MRVALAGNPNSGKTTLFNALTGANQRVGNWPGVTVDKKEGILKGHKEVIIEDLPGIYSLSPYTSEEIIARNYLLEDRPDLIINLVDASNLMRNLYLTSQLLELNIPMVIALNMTDIVEARGDKIDVKALSKALNLPIIEIVASKGKGVDKLKGEILKENPKVGQAFNFDNKLEENIREIEASFDGKVSPRLTRFFAIKAFEEDNDLIDKFAGNRLSQEDSKNIAKIRKESEEYFDDDCQSIISSARYDAIEEITSSVLTKAAPKQSLTDKIDKVVTSKIWGLPIFALVMFLVYFLSVYSNSPGTLATDFANGLFEERIIPGAASFLETINVNPLVAGLITDGILAGVGAVLGIIPQMMVLFALLSILEDIGYMSRVAFVMDRLFRKFGLSGKSFIPAMIATGCAVPGIQASRTIESERDKKITIMTASFMPCSAKLPVIALIAGAFFPEHRTIMSFSFYIIGILAIITSGIILKKFKELKEDPAPFIMELPEYHMPRPKQVLRDVLFKTKAYIKRAGTIILLSTVVIYILSNFSFNLQLVEGESQGSILGQIGSFIAPIFAPLGFNKWEAGVATITGFVAKENVVATMGVVLGVGSEVTETTTSLLTAMGGLLPSQLAAYSFLLFNMLCMPCFAAVGAIRTEMGSRKWTLITVAYQMGFAYLVSLIVYQLGRFFIFANFDLGVIIGFVALAFFIIMLIRKPEVDKRNLTLEKTYA